jgi:uncharacterized coiled-coil protein SlyX
MASKRKEEVEISAPEDDYEVVPLGPIRRLEKRLDSLESTKNISSLERFNDKIIDMIELNQHIVDEVVKANQGLRGDLARLIGKLDNLQGSLNEFIGIIKSAGESGVKEEGSSKLVGKLSEMNQKILESNSTIVDALLTIDKRLKRMQIGGRSTTDILARRSINRRQVGV